MVSNDENDVVISGIGGYFPKSKNIEEFTNVLFNQERVVGPAGWETEMTEKPDLIGVVDQINYFDASYFGIHRAQTIFMDPLCRMALENTFEALIDAGLNPASVRGKKVAVIFGSTLSENDSLMFESVENGFGVTGQARTMLANRVSYWMNVSGPSYSTDNSWLGAMQALKNGYEYVKDGHCEGVIVGAVNLARNMFPHHLYKNLNLVSADENTRAFDENATGYVRSEGVIIMYLERASTARRHYANILDIDIMFSGNRSGNITKMNVDSARKFLSNFYQRLRVDPSKVEYLETYGCGIKALDEFELNVIDSVFNRTKDNPLLVGSVKSNIGHTEAAAIFMSVVKTVIAMEKCKIPANYGFETPNSKIPALKDGRIQVVTESTSWPGTLAAINGLGLVSTFGHILLKSTTKPKKPDTRDKAIKLPHLYIASTRTEDGMREIIDTLKLQTSLNDEFMRMVSNVFSGNISGHLYRGYLVSKESETNNEVVHCGEEISHFSGSHRSVWFVYSGMGSQWISMGRDLLRVPIFAAAIAKCHAVLEPHGVNLTEVITSSENPNMFDNILHSFVGIAAIQIGLTDILLALGVKPDNMLGHSVGELGCAYADGCLTAEQMILSAYYRGRASLEVELTPGLMAAVGMGASKMQEILPPAVDIACRNGPDSCTISGPVEAMRQLVSTLQASGVFARLVDVAGIAYHSRYIRPAAPLLLNYLKKLIPNPKERSKKWLSTSVPEANGGWESERAKYCSPEYLTNNLLSAVYLEEALTHVPSDTIVIEIAPHGLLQAILKRSLDSNSINVTLTKRGEPRGVEFLLANLGKLYIAGIPIQIINLYNEDIAKPNKLECCSRNTPSLAPLVRWNHTETWRTGVDEFKDHSNSECSYMLDINTEMFNDLTGHRIFKIGDEAIGEGTITVPITTYLPLICGILSNIRRVAHIVFEDVQLVRHRVIPEALTIYIPPFRIMAQRGTGHFEVTDRYGLIASGRYIVPSEQELSNYTNDTTQQNIGKKLDELSKTELYREFLLRGHMFQSTFQAINKLEIYENGMIANIKWKTGWHMFAAAMLQMSIYRDGKYHQEPFDVFYFRSLSNSFLSSNIPKEGTDVDVVYNYATNKITSSIITIDAPSSRPYRIESNTLIAEQCSTPELKTTDAQVNNVAVVNIEESTIKVEDLTSDLEWVVKLKELLQNEDLEHIYLICRTVPQRSIDTFLASIRSCQNGHIVRMIIILDDSAPQFKTLTDSFYQSVFRQQNYCVAIYASNHWEFRSTTFFKVDTEKNIQDEFTTVVVEEHIRHKIPETNIKYVGINTISVVPNIFQRKQAPEKHQLGIVDYCGVDTKTNRPIMGLAGINKKNDLTADPILKWSIPKPWSYIDGATVPFAYTLAFYTLNELVSAKAGETILIHNGCSSIGQAMIRVAHSLGCYVYTTVGSEKQRVVLLEHLRMIRAGSIFTYTSPNFEIELMSATKGEGIDILVNCLPGEYLQCGLRCVAAMGRVIHLVDENENKDYYSEKIGLGIFLRVTGMYGVRPSKILELPEEMKIRLRDQVMEALKSEQIIIPIRRNIIRERSKLQVEGIVNYLCGPKVTGGIVIPIDNLTKKLTTTQNKCTLDESCYIIHGGKNIENTILLTHWLVAQYGARNIVLLTSNNQDVTNKKFLQRNLSIIKSQLPGICIECIEVPDNKPDVVIQQIKHLKLHNIVGVLLLSDGNTKNDETFIKALQVMMQTHIVLLSSISNTELINMERYHKKNIKNVSYLRWDEKRRFADVLKTLNNALEQTVDIFVRCETVDEEDSFVSNFSFEDYCNTLSTSIPSFSKWSPPNSNISVELVASKSPKKISECPPAFLIPGLLGIQCSYLQDCIRNLLCPVYVLDADYSLSLEQLATLLSEEVYKIYPNGPYNIIGVSTGGALAIELAIRLETHHNGRIQLYLLDGAPQSIKNMISEKNTSNNSYEITLLKSLLNIEDTKTISALTNASPNWNARVNAVLKDSIKKDKQMKLLFALKQRFDAVLKHQPNKYVLNGITRLLKPVKASREIIKLSNYCKHVKVEVIKGNHFTMLSINKLTDYINDNIITPQLYE